VARLFADCGGDVAAVDVLLGFERILNPLAALFALLKLADSEITVSSSCFSSSSGM